MVMILNAALAAAVNTWLKLHISTAQLARFSIVGVGLAIDAPIGGAGVERGVKYIQFKVVLEIVINWFVSLTVPGINAISHTKFFHLCYN